MSAVAIITARGGSRRIPRKNIRDFHGKPIIAYSIETAKASGLFDQIIVSTEDDEIRKVAHHYGVSWQDRPQRLAEDGAGTQEVMSHALNMLTDEYKYACCIYPCAPLMTASDLRRGLLLIKLPMTMYAVSVGTNPLSDAGQWYWGRSEAFIHAPDVLFDQMTRLFPLPPGRVCDINTEEDWVRAERLYADLYLTEGAV